MGDTGCPPGVFQLVAGAVFPDRWLSRYLRSGGRRAPSAGRPLDLRSIRVSGRRRNEGRAGSWPFMGLPRSVRDACERYSPGGWRWACGLPGPRRVHAGRSGDGHRTGPSNASLIGHRLLAGCRSRHPGEIAWPVPRFAAVRRKTAASQRPRRAASPGGAPAWPLSGPAARSVPTCSTPVSCSPIRPHSPGSTSIWWSCRLSSSPSWRPSVITLSWDTSPGRRSASWTTSA